MQRMDRKLSSWILPSAPAHHDMIYSEVLPSSPAKQRIICDSRYIVTVESQMQVPRLRAILTLWKDETHPPQDR